MSSTNGSVKLVEEQQGSASRLNGAARNGHDTRHAEEPPVVDATLDERDVRVEFTVNMHGRTTRLKEINLDRTVFESLDTRERWLLLKGIQDTVAELRRVMGHRLKQQWGLEDPRAEKEAPPGDPPEELKIHEPPGLGGASW